MSNVGHGYTPVFSSVFTGTLCGRYPDTAAWIFLLALADREGVVDMTPQAISALTGMPVPDLQGCIDRFCAVDPGSRSKASDGRRLVLIDASRDWGWRIVNFGLYREKARKQAYDSARTASGLDAARKRASRDVPRPPAISRSQTKTKTETETREEIRGAPVALDPAINLEAWAEWMTYRRQRRLPISTLALSKHMQALIPYPPEIQRAMVDTAIGANWRGLFPLKGNGALHKKPYVAALTTEELEAEEARHAPAT